MGNGVNDIYHCLHASLLPFASHIAVVRGLLFNLYVHRERDHLLEEIASYSIVYSHMDTMLLKIHNLCNGVPALMVPPRVIPLVSGVPKKRTRNPDDDHDDEYQLCVIHEDNQDRRPPKKRSNKGRQ